MDKNILISEMLYIIFVHYKGLGKHYKVGVLKNEMNRSLTSVKLLYKEELSDSDRASEKAALYMQTVHFN